MLACLIFSPLVQSIPAFATAPALLYVGAQMLRSAREIDWDDMTEAAPAFLTIVFMPFTYSIADGIAFGFISYCTHQTLVQPHPRRTAYGMDCRRIVGIEILVLRLNHSNEQAV